MQFPRVDVRYGLLSNAGTRFARHVEQIEIPIEKTCISQDGCVLLLSAERSMRSYMGDAARAKLASASQLARRDKDGFVEAAALVHLTLLRDGETHHSSQIHFLDQALEALEFEIYTLGVQYLADGARREVTDPVMLPRVALRDLMRLNREQFQLRQDSLMLAETRIRLEHLIERGDLVAAKNIAGTGITNACQQYGYDHWWHAVMLVRLGTALLRMGETEQAQRAVQHAEQILLEWTVDELGQSVFKKECTMLQAVRVGAVAK